MTKCCLPEPVEVLPAQIDGFARLYPHDIRRVQPLNGCVIKKSK